MTKFELKEIHLTIWVVKQVKNNVTDGFPLPLLDLWHRSGRGKPSVTSFWVLSSSFWKQPSSVLRVDKQQGALSVGPAHTNGFRQRWCQQWLLLAKIHSAGMWQWCNNPAAGSLLVGTCYVVGQEQFQPSGSDAATTYQSVTQTFCSPASSQHLKASNCIVCKASFQRSFEWVAKAGQIVSEHLMPFLWLACEFWETASTFNNFIPSDIPEHLICRFVNFSARYWEAPCSTEIMVLSSL